MRRVRASVGLALLASLVLVGCADDVPVRAGDGRIDADALRDGVTVVLDSGLGTVELPFELPVPLVADRAFEDEMRRSVSLFVASEASGATADLAAGILVDGTPEGPGQFSWDLDEDRDLATLTFYNESPGGLTMVIGRPYRAQLSVTNNAYVAGLAAISFPIAVTGP